MSNDWTPSTVNYRLDISLSLSFCFRIVFLSISNGYILDLMCSYWAGIFDEERCHFQWKKGSCLISCTKQYFQWMAPIIGTGPGILYVLIIFQE